MVGGRDSEYAMAFMDDLRHRLVTRVQLTTDGHKPYLEAVEGAFGDKYRLRHAGDAATGPRCAGLGC